MHLLGLIGKRFYFRILNFLHRWYVGSFLQIYHLAISLFESIDYKVAIKVSAKHLFVPMYGDKSITGHILGFIFRVIRIAIGLVAYAFIAVAATAVYLAWAALPILIIFWGIYG